MKEEEVAKKLMGLRPTKPVGWFAGGDIVVGMRDGGCPFRGVGNFCQLVRLVESGPNDTMHCGAAMEKPPECPLREGPVKVRLEEVPQTVCKKEGKQ